MKLNKSFSRTDQLPAGFLKDQYKNDLPNAPEETTSFGYAADLNAIVAYQNELNKTIFNIDKWPSVNQMKLNVKQTHLLKFKGDLYKKLSYSEITNCTSHRDLGLIVAQKLKLELKLRIKNNQSHEIIFSNQKQPIKPF